MSAKLTRSQSREVAFILLFEKTFCPDERMDELIEQAEQSLETPPDSFAKELALGSESRLHEIDALLCACSQNWKLSRISRVSLSAMRIAVYELLAVENIPAGASINEAIELTKKYATPEDAAYVNGVLGAALKRIQQSDFDISKLPTATESQLDTEAATQKAIGEAAIEITLPDIGEAAIEVALPDIGEAAIEVALPDIGEAAIEVTMPDIEEATTEAPGLDQVQTEA